MSAASVTSSTRFCCVCGEPLAGRYANALTCKDACRQALSRIRRAKDIDGTDDIYKRREFVRQHLHRSKNRRGRLLMERDELIQQERAL